MIALPCKGEERMIDTVIDKFKELRLTKVSRLFKRQITTAENPNH